MIIVRLLFSEPVGWLGHHQLYLDLGADIVMESITNSSAFEGSLGSSGAPSTFIKAVYMA